MSNNKDKFVYGSKVLNSNGDVWAHTQDGKCLEAFYYKPQNKDPILYTPHKNRQCIPFKNPQNWTKCPYTSGKRKKMDDGYPIFSGDLGKNNWGVCLLNGVKKPLVIDKKGGSRKKKRIYI